MSGVVPAVSADFSSVLNAVDASHGSCTILTWKPGLVCSKRLTPLVRNDWAAGTPHEPWASASFQMVMVGSLPPDALPDDELEHALATIARAAPMMTTPLDSRNRPASRRPCE